MAEEGQEKAVSHDEVPWLSEEEREGWLFLSSIMFNLPGQLENQLQRDSDMSFVEYMVLAMLSESAEHALTMTELARQTNTLLPRLSRVVTRLEKDNLVERSIWEKDRRVSVCHLLPAGLEKVRAAAPGHVCEVRRQIFDRLNLRHVRQLAKIGEAILGAKPSDIINLSNVTVLDNVEPKTAQAEKTAD
ncbi:MarR family winged helix-turn-helix transcriptional regulator [Rothia aerolata]|uniref:Transcriptional regulator n=1 Tax=Rothia aerolata TaxID=1812262 RepID=A0A917IXJ7_9MICC|nr:MarR family transcriptional regulator [Rothia aerolata]GGH67022.1 transcriptional regulator [Rothia aerolata]